MNDPSQIQSRLSTKHTVKRTIILSTAFRFLTSVRIVNVTISSSPCLSRTDTATLASILMPNLFISHLAFDYVLIYISCRIVTPLARIPATVIATPIYHTIYEYIFSETGAFIMRICPELIGSFQNCIGDLSCTSSRLLIFLTLATCIIIREEG